MSSQDIFMNRNRVAVVKNMNEEFIDYPSITLTYSIIILKSISLP